MTDLRKAAEMALQQLQRDDVYLGHRSKTRADAIEALRQALAQPDLAKVGEVGVWGHKREWVGLTDADKQEAFDETQEASGGFWDFADYLEAKLKEKNHG